MEKTITEHQYQEHVRPEEAYLNEAGFLKRRVIGTRVGNGITLYACRVCGAEDRDVRWVFDHQRQHTQEEFDGCQ
jgi:hypothetical protein